AAARRVFGRPSPQATWQAASEANGKAQIGLTVSRDAHPPSRKPARHEYGVRGTEKWRHGTFQRWAAYL
ncbi:MAG: hypothetical protein WA766_01490, partial [Candidatus Acidiferrales bacterium]